MRAVVLGGGIAGLSAAISLQRAGIGTTIVESAADPGGLAGGFREQGYTFDYFSHRLWTRDPEILALVEAWVGGRLLTRRKISRILLDGRLYNYPIDLRDLVSSRSAGLALRALNGYARARLSPAPIGEDFRSHVTARYGEALFDTFFGPYTEKLTGCRAGELAGDLAAGAVPGRGLLRQMLRRLIGRDDPWDDLYYPEDGFMALPEGMARAFRAAGGRLLTAHRVRRVRVEEGRIVSVEAAADAGTLTLEANRVISTIPFGTLLRALDPPADGEVLRAADALRTRAMVVVYLGIARERISEDHWIYVPDGRIRFNRLSETTNYSPKMAPPGRTGICAEIACDRDDAVWREGDEAQAARVIGDLQALGLLRSAGEVEAAWVRRFPRAYPIYRLGYRRPLGRVESYLDGIGNLRLCGRQGAFWYGSTAEGIRQGIDLVRGLADAPARAA